MRSGDVDASGDVWTYTPTRHKAQDHGRERAVLLGPRAQEVLRPWLREDPGRFLFSPAEAMAEFREGQRRRRSTPVYREKPRESNPRRPLKDHYSPKSYHHAIRKACERAGVAPWHPNQLRHNSATFLRRHHGIEVARIILGHADLQTTQIYAEADLRAAAKVVGQVG